jgi:hypothetical protein
LGWVEDGRYWKVSGFYGKEWYIKPLTTDETGSSNFNLQQKMFDFSPEDVRGYPKADKRKI